MGIGFTVEVDWDNDGWGGSADDITAYVKKVRISQGRQNYLERMARIGQCSLLLNNADRRFSPAYTGGPFYSRLVPKLPIRVQVTDGGTAYTVFTGYTEDWTPASGSQLSREAMLLAEDQLAYLQSKNLGLPLQWDVRSDTLVQLLLNAVWKTEPAIGTITINGQPAVGTTVTISYDNPNTGAVQGTRTYTFKTTASAANEVTIGADGEQAARHLAAAINMEEPRVGLTTVGEAAYGSATPRNSLVTAIADVSAGAGGGTAVVPVSAHNYGYSFGNIGDIKVRTAQRFTPVTGYLDTIIFTAAEAYGYDTTDCTWAVHTDNANKPGTQLISGIFDAPDPPGTVTVSGIGGPLLQGDNNYWLVFTKETPDPGWDFSQIRGEWDDGGIPAPNAIKKIGTEPWTIMSEARWSGTVITTSVPGGRVALKAVCAGAWGNDIGLAASGTVVVPGGTVMAGGTDFSTAVSLDTGRAVFEVGADTWGGMTNVLTALEEIARSEWGLIDVDEGGTIHFYNKDNVQLWANRDAVLTVDNTAAWVSGALQRDAIKNYVTIRWRPRGTLSYGIIAKAMSSIQVLPGAGQVGSQRWNSTDPLTTYGSRDLTIRMPYVDPETLQPIAAEQVTTPQPYVDYTVTDDSIPGVGFDYTGGTRITLSMAIKATEVEITPVNTATGSLWIHDLQVRGVGRTYYDEQQIIAENADSVELYGASELSVALPLRGDQAFAETLANALLSLYSEPTFRVDALQFSNRTRFAGSSAFLAKPGTILELSEGQLGLEDMRYQVLGRSITVEAGGASEIELYLNRIESTLWELEDAAYGLLGSTTTLGL